jgi:hypothetical protein
MAYPQQITAAENIRRAFCSLLRYAILLASCQAGKTGAYQKLIHIMLENGDIQRAYIVCGSSEILLRKQAIADTKKANGAAYKAGTIKVIFHNDFKTTDMDITNALIVVDESHMVQTQGQGLDAFLSRHGITMDGNPQTLNEQNTFVLSVDATPYSELAALKHKETPFEKHIEELVPGNGYYGLEHYWANGLLRSTFNIAQNLTKFTNLVKSVSGKWILMRLHTCKATLATEKKLKELCHKNSWNLLNYTSEEREVAITRNEQKNLGADTPCLEDAPDVTTIIILKGTLRAGKVVPKKHIGFVWEGAKNSKTDALVQGLPGRMCGYEFDGDFRPLIFVPSSALARKEDKILKASEIERAIMAHEMTLPSKGTNLNGCRNPNASKSGKTVLTPLRLDWPAADSDEWTPASADEYEAVPDKDVANLCREILVRNLEIIRTHPIYTDEQKQEILDFAETAESHIANVKDNTQFYKNVLKAFSDKTTAPHAGEHEMVFVVVHAGSPGLSLPGANIRHFYAIFHTKANSGGGAVATVPLEARIPTTTKKSIFSVPLNPGYAPPAAGGGLFFKAEHLKSKAKFEAGMRNFLDTWKAQSEMEDGLEVSNKIVTHQDNFRISTRAFPGGKDEVQALCSEIGAEYGIVPVVKGRKGRVGKGYFNLAEISW